MTIDLVSLFGVDLDTPDGLDVTSELSEVSGVLAFGQRLLRGLLTPRGSLALFDPAAAGWGFDVRTALNDDSPNVDALSLAIVEQLTQDECVETATATVTFNETASALTIVATVFTAAGPFKLTIAVSALTAELLNMEAV